MGAQGSAARGTELPLPGAQCQAQSRFRRSPVALRICCRRRREAKAVGAVRKDGPAVVKCQPPPFTIQKSTEREFARRYRLGGHVMESGHCGMTVRFAKRLSDGCEVVVKSRSCPTSFRGRDEEIEWRRTMEEQMRLPKASTLCDIMEVVETRENYHVVMERIKGQDLFETALQQELDSSDVRCILKQVLEGLALMHGAGRIHKDIKMENVMVSLGSKDHAAQAKIIDFDTVKDWLPFGPRAHTVVGTDGYIAPEAYRGEYSPASDMYAVGVMMYALLTNRLPYSKDFFDDEHGENYFGSPAMERIRDRLESHQVDFEVGELGACPAAVDLCKALLAFDTESRPSARQALAHAWFGGPCHLEEQETSVAGTRQKLLSDEPSEGTGMVVCWV